VLGADPVAAGVLKTAVNGARHLRGEGQPFGTRLAFADRSSAFRLHHEQTRRLPGRIVGETVDSNGRRSFVTTLRAREQTFAAKSDVERLHEPDLDGRHGRDSTRLARHAGAARIATRCAQGAHYLFDELVKIDGVRTVSTQPFSVSCASPRS